MSIDLSIRTISSLRHLLAQGLLSQKVLAFDRQTTQTLKSEQTMELIQFLPVGAIEYSLIYMLGGGGLIGALVIFVIAKMLRR